VGARRRLVPLLLAIFALLLAAAPAQASFHLIKVREVFPGTIANPDSDYVELQMYSSGQNLVSLGQLEVFGPTGTVQGQFTPSHNVTGSASQSTVLIVNSGFASKFPGISFDFTDEGLDLSPAGGAVCWPQTEPPFDDCASWGNFTGGASLPSPGDSSPGPTIPDGKALQRTISPGCSTLLENADDTNNSSVDFSAQTPNPRSNATAPSESECPGLPDTVLDTKPANPTKSTAASFTYHAIPATGASFECRLDSAAFASCPSVGSSYPGPLAEGSHSFEARAVNTAGADPVPAAYTWTIDTTPPTATVKNHPVDPSPGNSAAFTYQSSEVGSKFECSLVSGAGSDTFTSCPSGGKTYTNLLNGEYTFKVRATDPATNQGPAASFKWTVDNSLGDETPPETTIESRPSDPSSSPTASFSYASNEPGSSFECTLDGASFAPCPAGGITYAGLGAGPHSFQVRAIDPSDNKDPSPAGYSFQIVLVGALAPTPEAPPARPASPPLDTLLSKAATKTRDRTPTFRFRSTTPGASFQCKLDAGPFRTCRSPFTTKTLAFGRHTLKIRAVLTGATDPTPAVLRFKVERP
jgi:hypothetical protein